MAKTPRQTYSPTTKPAPASKAAAFHTRFRAQKRPLFTTVFALKSGRFSHAFSQGLEGGEEFLYCAVDNFGVAHVWRVSSTIDDHDAPAILNRSGKGLRS